MKVTDSRAGVQMRFGAEQQQHEEDMQMKFFLSALILYGVITTPMVRGSDDLKEKPKLERFTAVELPPIVVSNEGELTAAMSLRETSIPTGETLKVELHIHVAKGVKLPQLVVVKLIRQEPRVTFNEGILKFREQTAEGAVFDVVLARGARKPGKYWLEAWFHGERICRRAVIAKP